MLDFQEKTFSLTRVDMEHVKQWNNLLTTKLQPQLTSLEKKSEQTETTVQEYEQLLHLISTLLARPDPSGPIEARVEEPRGSGNYISAIADTSTIFVDLGKLKRSELTLEDAEQAIRKRIVVLQNQQKVTVQELEKLNKDIFVGMATVHQLQELEHPTTK